ncbi:4 TM domain-containing transmembrane protein, partial [Acrasis kona]
RKSSAIDLLPTRFLITVGYLISIIVVLCSRNDNISSTIPFNNKFNEVSYNNTYILVYSQADTEVIVASSLTIGGLSVQLLGLVGGCTMFEPTNIVIEIFFNTIGGILSSSYLIWAWHFRSIWIIWALFNVIPTLLSLLYFYKIFCQRLVQY